MDINSVSGRWRTLLGNTELEVELVVGFRPTDPESWALLAKSVPMWENSGTLSMLAWQRKRTQVLITWGFVDCAPSYKKSGNGPWLVWLGGLSTSLRTKGLVVPFPVRAHIRVAGHIPIMGA